jgi:hypothetical protein
MYAVALVSVYRIMRFAKKKHRSMHDLILSRPPVSGANMTAHASGEEPARHCAASLVAGPVAGQPEHKMRERVVASKARGDERGAVLKGK